MTVMTSEEMINSTCRNGFIRSCLGSTLYSGTSEVQRNIIAQWMGL